MQPNSESGQGLGDDSHNIPPSTLCSEPWWRSAGYNSVSSAKIVGNTSISFSFEQFRDTQSESGSGANEDDDDAIKESQVTASPRSDGSSGPEQESTQKLVVSIPPNNDESHTQPPQLELVGHTIAYGSNAYVNPYYGGMMAAYGPQPLVHPHLFAMQHARMPLPLEMAQEPVYVNAKQYHGILRRRQSRAKAELEKKLIKDRKPYLHESRHRHAMSRARSSGGRFAKKSEVVVSKCGGKGNGRGVVISSPSASSSGSEPLPLESVKNWSFRQEARGPEVHGTHESRRYVNHSNVQAPTNVSRSMNGGGEGESSGQQWRNTSSGNASQRGLAF